MAQKETPDHMLGEATTRKRVTEPAAQCQCLLRLHTRKAYANKN